MQRSRRWLTVVALGMTLLWWVPNGLGQPGSVVRPGSAPPAAAIAPVTTPNGASPANTATSASAAASPAGAAVTSAAPTPQLSVAAVAPVATKSSQTTAPAAGAVAPAAAPAPSPAVAGVRTAAYIVSPSEHDDTSLGQRLFRQAVDGSRTDPFNWAMHVYKSRHRIELYYKNQLFKTYHAVFGRGRLDGAKEWEGDSRTPEGAYLIVAKHRSFRFRWFLKLNYPNATDEARFAELRAAHKIPAYWHEGSMVGIHGTDSPVLNLQDVNWTLGCISVDNADIAEMASLLPVGTLVVINP